MFLLGSDRQRLRVRECRCVLLVWEDHIRSAGEKSHNLYADFLNLEKKRLIFNDVW